MGLLLQTIPASASDITTTFSVSPVNQAVDNGDNFTLNLLVNTSVAIRGWQTDLTFDAAKVQCSGVTISNFLKDYAQAHGGSTTSMSCKIDNTLGKITAINCCIMGASNAPGATGTGILCTLAFTAKSAVNSSCQLSLANALASDSNADEIPGLVVHAASVDIGNVSQAASSASSSNAISLSASTVTTEDNAAQTADSTDSSETLSSNALTSSALTSTALTSSSYNLVFSGGDEVAKIIQASLNGFDKAIAA